MRPKLIKGIQIDDFKSYYWLKKELEQFCQKNGISRSGSKVELTSRIEEFLRTGEVIIPPRKTARLVKQSVDPSQILSLDTVITEDHRCSQNVRVFFKSIIGPKFHFSTYIQNFFKENAGKTYRDAVDAWHEEEERKKQPSYKTKIGNQFEYNQFTRDFFADPKNKEKHRKDVIKAWNEVKSRPGSNKYAPH